MSTKLWENNEIQFARLIAEAEAAGAFQPNIVESMAASMDLEPSNVYILIDRAQQAFEDHKAKYCPVRP